jgi:phenylacetate-CoA ligase
MRGFYSSKIYKKLPIFLQNSFVTAQGLIYTQVKRGKRFRILQKELAGNEKLSFEELSSLQLTKLKELMQHAFEWVPYYKNMFNKLGFDPIDIKSADDLKKLPLLEKETVRDHFEDFVALDVKRSTSFKGSTSGTTGSPLSIYMNRNVIETEHAFVWRQYRWAGRPWRGRTAVFRGELIVPVEQKRPPFWRYDAYSKELYFSTYHLSESTYGAYIEQLQRFDPEFIYAYPSILFMIAQWSKKYDYRLSFNSLHGIVTSSETIYGNQKSMIEEVFRTQVFDWYGLFERVIFIGTCEYGSYHIFPDYGITELIPIKTTENNGLYELIGTGFINSLTPLIRYRTGDIVSLINGTCKCGRKFPCVGSILGRSNDVIMTSTGRVIVMVDYAFDAAHIRFAQIIQESIKELIIMIVPDSGYSMSDEKKIIDNMKQRVGKDMNIAIQIVEEIPRLPNGKCKLIVSKMGQSNIH